MKKQPKKVPVTTHPIQPSIYSFQAIKKKKFRNDRLLLILIDPKKRSEKKCFWQNVCVSVYFSCLCHFPSVNDN